MLPKLMQMSDLNLTNKRVLIREDLNVPIQNAQITDYNRLEAAIPTIQMAQQAGAKVLLLSHLGQPKPGNFDPEYSLAPVAAALGELLKQPVPLIPNWLDHIELKSGEVALAENVRFLPGELENSPDLAKRMAKQCDIFVMDAFATAHRAQSSTSAIIEFAPLACAGPLLIAELEALAKVLEHPQRPLAAIVGGAKVSSKIHLLNNLLSKVDCLIVGGGIANTLLAADNKPIGKSLYEPAWLDQGKKLIEKAKEQQVMLPLPIDVVTAEEFSPVAKPHIKEIVDIKPNELILDIGPQTAELYSAYLKKAKMIIWNGPVGVFEFDQFSQGTRAIAKTISESTAYSVAGGGDTVSALNQFEISDKISYISTGGGAFLELLEGKSLPAIDALMKRANENATHTTK